MWMSLPQYATYLRRNQLAPLKLNISPQQEYMTVKSKFVKTTCMIVWLLLVTPTAIVKGFKFILCSERL